MKTIREGPAIIQKESKWTRGDVKFKVTQETGQTDSTRHDKYALLSVHTETKKGLQT